MKITFALLRVALCSLIVLLPFAAMQWDFMIRGVSLVLVLSVIAAFFMAFIELALLVTGRSSAAPHSRR